MTKNDLVEKLNTVHWYCVRWNSIKKEPEYVDIVSVLDADALFDSIAKYKSIQSYEDLAHWVRMSLRSAYHFKAEYEINITGILGDTTESYKIDIWEQVAPNIVSITNLINNKLCLFKNNEENVEKEPTSIGYRNE